MNKGLFTKSDLAIFLLIIICVTSMQFVLLASALEIGFKPDDWILYFSYKALGSNPLVGFYDVWVQRGIYTTYQVYYLGFLESFLGFNYFLFQVASLIFKSLGTSVIFPLVLVIFRNRLLAVLTTIIFAFHPSSIGPLEFAVKGSDYLAIFWMCIFLITYYLIVKTHTNNLVLILGSLLLLFLTIAFSPIRLFPVLGLLLVTETYILVKNHRLSELKIIALRVLVFYTPMFLLIFYAPDSIFSILEAPKIIIGKIIQGNWHLILIPFSGIGVTFIPNDYWRVFGLLNINNMQDYIFFLLGGPSFIFGLLTLSLAFILSKKPWSFFLRIFVFNFSLEVVVFFVATYFKNLPPHQRWDYDQTGLVPALFGLYIVVLGAVCFIMPSRKLRLLGVDELKSLKIDTPQNGVHFREPRLKPWVSIDWLGENGDNYLLKAFWAGSLFVFLFTFATWLFSPFGTSFSSTSYYLVVASIGSSLIIAAFLIAFCRLILSLRMQVVRTILLILFFLASGFIFDIYKKEIQLRFNYLLLNGRSAKQQQLVQDNFRENVINIDFTNPTLFYFDTTDISGQGPFYSEGFLISFPFWMHFHNNKLRDGCMENLYFDNREKLLTFFKEINGQKGFIYRSLCIVDGKVEKHDNEFYAFDNFFAFGIKNKEFINITNELLEELMLY